MVVSLGVRYGPSGLFFYGLVSKGSVLCMCVCVYIYINLVLSLIPILTRCDIFQYGMF